MSISAVSTRLPVTREATQIDWSDDAAEKGGYAHYMLKEIYEQPDSIWNTIRGRMDLDRGNCGSYRASMLIRAIWRNCTECF